MAALKDVLEGKPWRAPLHVALVHVPIALFPLSVIFDLVAWAGEAGDAGLVRAAFWCVVGGIVSGLVAGAVGIVDYTDIRDDHPAKKTATWHMVLNLVALGMFAVGAGLRYGNLDTGKTPGAAVMMSLVGLGLLGYSGYLGGHLVYSDGIGVGRHRRRNRMPEKTLKVSGRAVEEVERVEGWVAVADEMALGEGETLRVEVDGQVMAIARIEGRVYAFQEFCTHRYGPLSEGALRGCEVQCPWHNSRFDVRTGKVTQGPAKVELKTWPAEVRDGKVWVSPGANKKAAA